MMSDPVLALLLPIVLLVLLLVSGLLLFPHGVPKFLRNTSTTARTTRRSATTRYSVMFISTSIDTISCASYLVDLRGCTTNDEDDSIIHLCSGFWAWRLTRPTNQAESGSTPKKIESCALGLKMSAPGFIP